MNNLHNPNSYENLDNYNQQRHSENFYSGNTQEFNPAGYIVANEISNSNELKHVELLEKQAMRRAYCKANDIPYEEIEIPTMQENLSQGSLKVLCFIVWLFIAGVIISSFIGEGNFLTNFMKVWF